MTVIRDYIDYPPAKPGDLVRLYNCYTSHVENPATIVGLLLGTSWEAQFEFYEVAVLQDEQGYGGYVQRYLTSDFFVGVLPPPAESEEEKDEQKEKE